MVRLVNASFRRAFSGAFLLAFTPITWPRAATPAGTTTSPPTAISPVTTAVKTSPVLVFGSSGLSNRTVITEPAGMSTVRILSGMGPACEPGSDWGWVAGCWAAVSCSLLRQPTMTKTAHRDSEVRFIEVRFNRKAAINHEPGYGAAAATLCGHWSSVGCHVLSGLYSSIFFTILSESGPRSFWYTVPS